ncbi:MAG: Uma2 family endonuclease [Planctomycetaceae bacterium]|nr:Uma2 family endonuclease [Planctomycetaceae bacterium]
MASLSSTPPTGGLRKGLPVLSRPGLPPYRLSVDQYEAMVASGVLTKHDRLELIEGVLIAKMTKGPRHSAVAVHLGELLRGVLPKGWHIRLEQPLRIPERSEPEPDLAVIRGASLDYEDRHPGPAEVALVVEVAESSLTRDREIMGHIYAAAGIPVYWIVNLKGRSRLVEVYTRPTRTRGYRIRDDYRPGQDLALKIEGKEIGRIAVADLFPVRP